jgi:hypothetical protein
VQGWLFGLLRSEVLLQEGWGVILRTQPPITCPPISKTPPYLRAACNAANCTACATGSATTCVSCNGGYTLINGQCSLSECRELGVT